MNKTLFGKSLVIGIVVLFIGVGIQPAFAVETIYSNKNTLNEETEPKDYLFQTIIDIANNPDVKTLLDNNNHDIFTSDFDYRDVFYKLLVKNPILLYSILFTKPSMTHEYLDFTYNQGCKITNILGEDRVLEIIDSIEVTNPELFDELNAIISNNEKFSSRISILKNLNEELKPDSPFWDFPIICTILLFILSGLWMIWSSLYMYLYYLDIPIIGDLLAIFLGAMLIIISQIHTSIAVLYYILNCFPYLL